MFNDSWYIFAVLQAAILLQTQTNYQSFSHPISVFGYLKACIWLTIASTIKKEGWANFFYLLPFIRAKPSNPKDKTQAKSNGFIRWLVGVVGSVCVIAPLITMITWSYLKVCHFETSAEATPSCSNIAFFAFSHIFLAANSWDSQWYLAWLALSTVPFIYFHFKTEIKEESKFNQDQKKAAGGYAQNLENQQWVTAGHCLHIYGLTGQSATDRFWSCHFYYFFTQDRFLTFYSRKVNSETASNWDHFFAQWVWLHLVLRLLLLPVTYACQIIQI